MKHTMLPATATGRHARRLLSAATEPPASIGVKDVAVVLRVRRRRTALSKVMGAAFGSVARRLLTFSSDSEIKQYAQEVLARQDLFLPSMLPDVQTTEAVLRHAIRRSARPKRRRKHDFVEFAVLTDLCGGMSVTDVDELVALAELRSGIRRIDQSDLDAVLDQLTTDIGRVSMKLTMTRETDGTRIPVLIDDNHAVLDAAFELASIRMLGRPLSDAELDTWAARVARLVPDGSPDEIKAIVRNPYGYSISAMGEQVDLVIRVGAASAASLLMCLLPSEAPGRAEGRRATRTEARLRTRAVRVGVRAFSAHRSLAELDGVLAQLDESQPFPESEIGVPRGRQGSPRTVSLPAGWLDDPHGVDDDLSDTELSISGC